MMSELEGETIANTKREDATSDANLHADRKYFVSFPKAWLGAVAILIVIGFLFASQITLFIIQPLGAIPEGRTLVIFRLQDGKLIDSADAMCQRKIGGVSLMCRLMVLGAVAEKSQILMRLPYSETLYHWSTNGAEYDR